MQKSKLLQYIVGWILGKGLKCVDVLEAPSDRVKREGVYNFTNTQVLKSASRPHRAWEVFLCAQARC